MAYTPQYASSDFIALIFDFMGTVFAVLIDNIALIVTLVIAGIAVYLCRNLLSSIWGMIGGIGGRR